MSLRTLSLVAALTLIVSPVVAQTCVPKPTPDMGATAASPTLFRWCTEEDKCGVIDKTGAWFVPPKFENIVVAEGFIGALVKDSWGFVDRSGQWLAEPAYFIDSDDPPFGEGMAAVVAAEKTGYIDTKGTLVVPPQFDEGGVFREGLASVVKGDKRGYIDKTGAWAVEPKGVFDFLDWFREGVAVAVRAEKYGLIDRTGAVLIEPQFNWLSSSTGGLLVAERDGKSGIVDRTGKFLVEPKFDELGEFSQGLAPAKLGGKWGFIDICGTWAVEPKYDDVFGFNGGPATVKLGEKWGLIDRDGTEILVPSMASILSDGWTEGLTAFAPGENLLEGIMDAGGKVVIAPRYQTALPLGGGVIWVYEGETEQLLNLDGTEIKVAPTP